MNDIFSGQIYRYAYLWARESDRGEESGRKDRPVCVQIILAGSDGAELTLLFPITSQPPQPDVAALEIPALEAKRASLRLPAWVIVEEWNEDDLSTSPYLANTMPEGAFSRHFAARIARAAAAAILARRYRRVKR